MTTREKRFVGKNIALTGCSTGLGRALALAFAREGAQLALADIDQARLQELLSELLSAGASAMGMRVDVSSAEDVEAFRDAALARFGTIHVVCSNAGVNECPAPAWHLEATDWEWVLGVNLHGLVNVARSFVPVMLSQGHGHIVSTASNTSLVSTSGVAAYVSSKKANLGYCEALQHDLRAAGSNVRVSVVFPGKIMSEMPNSARSRPQSLPGRIPSDEELSAMRAYLAKAGKEPAEVAESVLDGIAAGRFYIFTHDDDLPATLAWAEGVKTGELAWLNEQPPKKTLV